MPAQHGTEGPYYPGTRDRGISDSTVSEAVHPRRLAGQEFSTNPERILA
jgi:hypothetical protein